MIPLTVTPCPPVRRRWTVTRPDRRDTVILCARTPEEAASEAAQEWSIPADGYTVTTPAAADTQENPA